MKLHECLLAAAALTNVTLLLAVLHTTPMDSVSWVLATSTSVLLTAGAIRAVHVGTRAVKAERSANAQRLEEERATGDAKRAAAAAVLNGQQVQLDPQ